MSTIKVTNLSGRGGASPNLPDGANVTGVLTATSFVGSGANLTGLANTDFINAEQLTVVGVVTAGTGNIGNLNITKSAAGAGATVGSFTGVTTYYGDGGSLTGVGETVAPWNYNPDLGDIDVALSELSSSGIGITFNKKVSAGSGTATLKIVNAGAAGTTIQSWGVSSCTFNITAFSLDANVSDLVLDQTYQIDIPEGFIVDSNETSYVGTAWTFTATGPVGRLFSWGADGNGSTGLNSTIRYSSPVQVGGISWKHVADMGGGSTASHYGRSATKTDGTLWAWGLNSQGECGQNSISPSAYSSPIQIPGTTWKCTSRSYIASFASKDDGTLWAWGRNNDGKLGQNNQVQYSSPVQIPGTTWTGEKETMSGARNITGAIKTDGTLWMWGDNPAGQLGQNNEVKYSSPAQIPGTTWSKISVNADGVRAIKTDGTLWAWGKNNVGQLGLNTKDDHRSSPIQIPGTTWAYVQSGNYASAAIKTDGTLYTWGYAIWGQLGHNQGPGGHYSSPVQLPGTWSKITMGEKATIASKTDGTLWSWGGGENGVLGVPSIGEGARSSPVQIPGTEWTGDIEVTCRSAYAIQNDQTP